MILKGTLRRLGGQILDGSMGRIDALEIGDHPEIRNVRGTTYILNHLHSSAGDDVAVGMVGKAVIGVRKRHGTYVDTSFRTSLTAHIGYWVACIPLVLLTGGIGIIAPVALYFWSRAQLRRIAAELQSTTV